MKGEGENTKKQHDFFETLLEPIVSMLQKGSAIKKQYCKIWILFIFFILSQHKQEYVERESRGKSRSMSVRYRQAGDNHHRWLPLTCQYLPLVSDIIRY